MKCVFPSRRSLDSGASMVVLLDFTSSFGTASGAGSGTDLEQPDPRRAVLTMERVKMNERIEYV